jgi:hypothetical protein
MSPFGRGGRSQSGPDRAAFFRLRRSGHGEALLLRRPSVRLSQKGLLEERLFCRSAQSLNFHQIIHKNTFTYDFFISQQLILDPRMTYFGNIKIIFILNSKTFQKVDLDLDLRFCTNDRYLYIFSAHVPSLLSHHTNQVGSMHLFLGSQ